MSSSEIAVFFLLSVFSAGTWRTADGEALPDSRTAARVLSYFTEKNACTGLIGEALRMILPGNVAQTCFVCSDLN